ncbi:serine/threonine-protein phosphatase 2A regulatory subunit B'' subunit beta-like, partial [Sorex fumeus]|uniref:serine/threonine-protein phosphatase 2A regulatory subunit B'' subunit beta-like n=1 Tax=Sorex fumeus TaxID=62283 RepID=UPI0024ADE5C0
VQLRREEPLPPGPSRDIPTFYFPRGRPQDTVNVDAVIAHIERTFADFPQERATMDDMGRVAKACGCPLYWKGPLFYGAGGERTSSVSVHKFIAMWRKTAPVSPRGVLLSCHDDAAKFAYLLMNPGCNYLVQEDFVPFLQTLVSAPHAGPHIPTLDSGRLDVLLPMRGLCFGPDVVNSHPGLSFLKEASEFHSRYITTVIQWIFYTVNRSWTGRITCAELRRSTFLQNVALLEEEPDINQLTKFFSYEHFYVIYCKFWELDTDHDLLIDADDLARHNDHTISTRMIERIFSGAVTRYVSPRIPMLRQHEAWTLMPPTGRPGPPADTGPSGGRASRGSLLPGRGKKVQKEGKISYADFMWFLISEEDKKTPTRSLSMEGPSKGGRSVEGPSVGALSTEGGGACRSIEYWFCCMDLDEDGALTMFELEHFYEKQCRRLDSMAIKALPFEDCLCQMLDLVKPQTEVSPTAPWWKITLRNLKRCKLACVFFETFKNFNIEKYLDHEQKEDLAAPGDSDSEGPELSDWEKYAAEEYDILVAEEAAGETWDDGYEAELSPVEQKLSSLRPALAQRPFFESLSPLGDVELYEYESEDEEEQEEEDLQLS